MYFLNPKPPSSLTSHNADVVLCKANFPVRKLYFPVRNIMHSSKENLFSSKETLLSIPYISPGGEQCTSPV